MSLKHKLTALFAVTLILLMLVTSLATQRVAKLAVENEIREKVNAAAVDIRNALLREVARRGYLTNTNAIAVMTQALAIHPSLSNVDLTYWMGNRSLSFTLILTPYGPQYEPLDPTNKIAAAEPDKLRQEYWFRAGPRLQIRLGIWATLGEADRLAARLSRIFMLTTACALLLLLGIIYALSHRLVSSPLQHLAGLTGRVAQGELEAEPGTHLAKRNDEIGELATSFQRMLAALRKARDDNEALLDRTRGFNRELEARVTEATEALANKNEALIAARLELSRQERLAALGQLAGNIAHELGTPLSTLSGYLQLTLADSSLPESQREPLLVAAGEAERMTRIIRRFLDSTRGLRPSPEPVELEPLIDEVLELAQPPGAARRLVAHVEIDPDAEVTETDPGLLRQILINLVNNARDAMGGAGTIEFRATRENDEAVLEIEDTGPGIPHAQREVVFEPFYTTKAPGTGTGLGLPISREIMLALKGSLSILDARSGQGVRFVLRLPARPPRK